MKPNKDVLIPVPFEWLAFMDKFATMTTNLSERIGCGCGIDGPCKVCSEVQSNAERLVLEYNTLMDKDEPNAEFYRSLK